MSDNCKIPPRPKFLEPKDNKEPEIRVQPKREKDVLDELFDLYQIAKKTKKVE